MNEQSELNRQHLAATSKPQTPGQTLWFLGLPASGKTTLASKVATLCNGYVRLDGDEVRKAVENFEMGEDARLVHLSYMAFCCHQLNLCGINVAAAFVTPLQKHRERIQQILPAVKFIWLQCAPKTCADRDPKGLWKRAASGQLSQLTGAGGSWEDPTQATLTIRTDTFSIEESFNTVKKHFALVTADRPAGLEQT